MVTACTHPASIFLNFMESLFLLPMSLIKNHPLFKDWHAGIWGAQIKMVSDFVREHRNAGPFTENFGIVLYTLFNQEITIRIHLQRLMVLMVPLTILTFGLDITRIQLLCKEEFLQSEIRAGHYVIFNERELVLGLQHVS